MTDFSISAEARLGPVHLAVADLRRAMRFYGDILGLWTVNREDGQLSLSAVTDGGEPLLVLVEQPEAVPRAPHTTGLYHYALLLSSRAHLARALAHLAEIQYPLQGAADHTVSEALYLADPDGNGIEIYADRPRSSWPRRNGQLEMRTDPLDIESLMAESEEDDLPWEGMPSDTRVGHIHLQVANLERAEQFYEGVLGFDLMQRYGHSAAFLSAGGYHHHVALNTWAGVGAAPPPPEAVGLRYFTICLPNAEELKKSLQRIKDAGVAVEEKEEGVLLRDPSENGILLSARCE